MQAMHELKDMLCDELDELVKSGKLTINNIDVIDKLTHSIKSLVTIIAMEDSGYSYDYRRDTKRTPDRRYSRDDSKSHMMMQIEKLMDGATDREKEVLHEAINQLKNMQ